MRKFLRLLLIVSSCFTVLAVFLLMSARDQRIAQYDPIAPEFLPGKVLPPDMTCESAYYSMDYFHLYCRALRDSQQGNLYVTFDEREKLIVHTTLIDPGKTIGELILAWGVPNGFNNVMLGNYVYWPGRYAYVASKAFGPSSAVGFIVYDNTIKADQPWTGFLNRRH